METENDIQKRLALLSISLSHLVQYWSPISNSYHSLKGCKWHVFTRLYTQTGHEMSSVYECVLQAHLFTHKQLCIQISKNRGRNHISSRAYLQKKDWTCAIFFRPLLIFFAGGGVGWGGCQGYTSDTLTTDQLQPASYNIGFQRTGLQYMVLTLGGHCSRTTAV